MAILAAVLVPTVTSKIKQANQSSANSEASSYANSIKTDIIALQSNITSSLDLLVAGVDASDTDAVNVGTSTAIYAKFDTTKMDGGTGMKKDHTTFSVVGGVFKVSTTVGGATVEYTVTVDTANGGKITVSEPDYK